jgi:hypothetical protein
MKRLIQTITATLFLGVLLWLFESKNKTQTAIPSSIGEIASETKYKSMTNTREQKRTIIETAEYKNAHISKKNLVNPKICLTRHDCPYDLFSVYDQSINTYSASGNELSFVLLQRKIDQSDLTKTEKTKLLGKILKSLSQTLEKGRPTQSIGNNAYVTYTAGLYVTTLDSFLRNTDSLRYTVEVVQESMWKSKDAYLNRLVMDMLLRKHPEATEKIAKHFGNKRIAGI